MTDIIPVRIVRPVNRHPGLALAAWLAFAVATVSPVAFVAGIEYVRIYHP